MLPNGKTLDAIQYYDVKRWLKEGVKTSEEAIAWKKSGALYYSNNRPNGVSPWIKAGVKTPQEAREWVKVKIFGQSIQKVLEAGVKTPQEVMEWRKVGITDVQHISFLKHNNILPNQILKDSVEANKNLILFLKTFFPKSSWVAKFQKVKKECVANDCFVAYKIINTAKVLDGMLLVSIDKSPFLLKFDSDGSSSSDIPDIFILISNKGKSFGAVLKYLGKHDVQIDGEPYKIEKYKVVVSPSI